METNEIIILAIAGFIFLFFLIKPIWPQLRFKLVFAVLGLACMIVIWIIIRIYIEKTILPPPEPSASETTKLIGNPRLLPQKRELLPGATDSIPIYGCYKIYLDGAIEVRKGKYGKPFTVKPGSDAMFGKCGTYTLYVTDKENFKITVLVEPKPECKRYDF